MAKDYKQMTINLMCDFDEKTLKDLYHHVAGTHYLYNKRERIKRQIERLETVYPTKEELINFFMRNKELRLDSGEGMTVTIKYKPSKDEFVIEAEK